MGKKAKGKRIKLLRETWSSVALGCSLKCGNKAAKCGTVLNQKETLKDLGNEKHLKYSSVPPAEIQAVS